MKTFNRRKCDFKISYLDVQSIRVEIEEVAVPEEVEDYQPQKQQRIKLRQRIPSWFQSNASEEILNIVIKGRLNFFKLFGTEYKSYL